MDEQLELTPEGPEARESANEEETEEERERLVAAIAASRLDTVQQRVAWILNHHPEARDSDVALWIQYWKRFQSEWVEGEYVRLRDLYRLTRPGSLTRARAKIQNEYRMFLASVEVRAQRGKLSEEERERAAVQRAPYPNLTVYLDETGKTGKHVVVGAVWLAQGFDMIETVRAVERVAKEEGVEAELHFKTIDDRKIAYYKRIVDLVVDRAATVTFMSVSVDRPGLKSVERAIADLQFHLLVRGIEHHQESGRAPLPRTLDIFKDSEEPGRDRLVLADIRERLLQASEGRFDGKLEVERVGAYDSEGNVLIQLADLYTSSVGRVLNRQQDSRRPKDLFADYFLGRLGTPVGPTSTDTVGDLSVHITL